MATKKASSKTPTRIDITFIGGSFDGKELEFVYPAPEYLVMNRGLDLYKRACSTDYKYQTDWSEYEYTIDKDRIYK